jgi:hypothetical protein
MRSAVPRWLALAMLSSPCVLAACSLLQDLSGDQCELNADCRALGGEFNDRVCVAGLCVDPNAGNDAGTGGEGGSSTSDGPCESNADCLDRAESFGPVACVEGECVGLLSEECPVVLPQSDDLWLDNLRLGDSIVVGAYAYVPPEVVGIQTRNYDLALTEFTRRVNGLPGPGGKRRGLVAVVCDNTPEDTDELDRSFQHLAQTLRVPGIIAALRSDDLQRVFESDGLDRGMLFVSPAESDAALAGLLDDGLVWHMVAGGREVAVTYAPLLQRTLDYLDVDGTVRIALVTASDIRYLAEMESTLEKTLEFNGRSVAQNFSDGNYKSISITSVYTNPNANLGNAVSAVLDLEPHVVIAAAADEFLARMVPAIEAGWPGGNSPPFYFLSPFHYNNPALDDLVELVPEVAERIAGVNAPSAADAALYDTYQIAFDSAYPDVAGTRGYENYYDAAYFLIYSAAAAGSVAELTGREMARGMTRLLAGPEYAVGIDDIPEVLSVLSSSSAARVTLNGTLGPPSFDSATGTRQDAGSVWCVDADGFEHADVLRYDADSGQLTGEFSCISGF